MDGDFSEIKNNTSVIFPEPSGPKARKTYRTPVTSEDSKINGLLLDSKESHMKEESYVAQQRRKSDHVHESSVLSDGSNRNKQITDNSDEELDEQEPLNHSVSKSPNYSKTNSSERINCSEKFSPERANDDSKNDFLENSWSKPFAKTEKSQSSSIKQNSSYFPIAMVIIPLLVACLYLMKSNSTNKNQIETTEDRNSIFTNENQIETTDDRNSIFKLIEDVKAKYYSQDSHIWDEISSGINEMKTRTPKVPSIILLFANETHTMDCLALELAHISSNALGGDSPLNLNPKDFGNDPGEIIDTLKDVSANKKAVIIHDVLNINAEGIKALHNLCDRINPSIREVIYIITMQTKNYESSQHKMAFVERQLYRKLSKSIDEDILMALITRITDGAIISVQSEPNLRYC